ncbi:hypothetical protein M427DRAFT_58321 [Gonapodya prolifera JEL478]|uniref:Uncharacterized protein n=1 Tax=Gonapodya prolifera (strain JEL478) TaxID=1344416 RepID=A0A139AAG8_GONPJ|nr:hypothetical protein M427DRAFT_58321 [Gonapodya prolifera JEL478]|eukprot:KXS13727.1 hypothetical protein M427DRAFT_58321 [Gonapodya prolifera JEL478]
MKHATFVEKRALEMARRLFMRLTAGSCNHVVLEDIKYVRWNLQSDTRSEWIGIGSKGVSTMRSGFVGRLKELGEKEGVRIVWA